MELNATMTIKQCGDMHEFFQTKLYLYLTIITFILITVFTFVGNLLVVVAITTTKSLNTVTNSFIRSLAAADMLVAIFVLPMSIYVIGNDHKWKFNSIICDIWAAFDVMLCTASILNLCCISLDRYFAITRPLQYSRARSPNLARNMIAVVWIASVLISCPPIFGWKDPQRHLNPETCSLNLLLSYRIYSSIGSFYLPALVIIFVYIRIFIVIHKREKHLMLNSKESTKIRVNRGKPNKTKIQNKNVKVPCKCATNEQLTSKLMEKRKNLIKLAQIRSSLENITENTHLNQDGNLTQKIDYSRLPIDRSFPMNYGKLRRETLPTVCYDEFLTTKQINDRKCSSGNLTNTLPCNSCLKFDDKSSIYFIKNQKNYGSDPMLFIKKKSPKCINSSVKEDKSISSELIFSKKSRPCCFCCFPCLCLKRVEFTQPNEVFSTNNASIQSKSGSKSHEHLRLLRESKASKVLAIVVAGFICCWLPFFVIYVLESVCVTCCFSIVLIDWVTWLGYFNSVINPFIYAFYSKPFRAAFYRITLARLKQTSDRKNLIV